MAGEDALQDAALAFDSAMGNSPAPKPSGNGSGGGKGAPVEQMFENLGEFVDGGDDEPAGGDGPTPAPKKVAKQEIKDEDDEPEIYEDDDGNQFTLDADGNPVAYEPEEDDKKKGDDDEDDDEDELMSREFEVMVDGEEIKVPLKEALKGYIRTETFHKRLNSIDQAATALSEEAEAVVAERTKLIKLYKDAEEKVKILIPEEPDWDKLYEQDPKAARALQKQFDAVKAKHAELKGEREKAEKEAAEAEAVETAKFAKKEFGKFAAFTKWRNKEDMGRDLSSMKRTGTAAGFSAEELATVYDSRMLAVLYKASKYDRMMANKPKPVLRGGKPIAPGAGTTRTAHKGADRAMKKLNRTGSIDDATDVFANILKRS